MTAKSVKAMKAEFLAEGSNYEQIRAQIGHLDVRSKEQWEGIAEHLETGPLETFDQAFKALARASRAGGRGALSWERFPIKLLRECPGLERLELPARVRQAEIEQATEEHHYGSEVPF